jgi:ADP-ribose pyrophosphatase YjhB (NUDIX family)
MTLSGMNVSDMKRDSTIDAAVAADEAIWRPHVTVATVVPRDGRFLLVEEDVRGRVVLNQPAGHLDPDEPLQAAAVRETLEETGWDIELDCLLCVQQWQNSESGRHFVRFTFAGRPLRHHPERALDDGILRAIWLSREEIAAESERLRSPMVLASVDDWLAGHRLPLDAIRYLSAHP